MSSYTQLAVVNLQAGMLQFSMWALQEMSSGSLTSSFHSNHNQREGKFHTKEWFQASACTTFANGPLAKTRRVSKLGFQEREDITSDEKSSDVTSLRSMGGMPHHIFTKSLPWEPQLPPTGPGMSTIVQALVGSQGKIIPPVPQGTFFRLHPASERLPGTKAVPRSRLPVSPLSCKASSWHIFTLCVCSSLLSADCFISLYFWHRSSQFLLASGINLWHPLPSGPAVNQLNLPCFPVPIPGSIT